MSKIFKIFLVILIIISLFMVHISYAISNKETEKKSSFMELSAKELAIGETLSITFNLDSIEEDVFKIQLSSNISLDKIYTNDIHTIELKDNKSDISIEVDKNKMDLDKITIYYNITENLNVGKQ